MADTPARGSFLTRKVGPLPMWLVLVLSALATWWLFRRAKSSTAATGTQAGPASSPAAAPQTDTTGLTGATGTSGDVSGQGAAGVNPADLLSSLGAQNNALTSALLTQEQDIAANAAAEVAAFQNGAGGASTTTNISNYYYGKTKPQPGSHNTPTVHHVPKAVPSKAKAKTGRVRSEPMRKPPKKPVHR